MALPDRAKLDFAIRSKFSTATGFAQFSLWSRFLLRVRLWGWNLFVQLWRRFKNRGTIVQLHLHPEWAPHIPGLDHIAGVPIANLKLEEQVELFRAGVSNLQAAGAPAPCAYRAGDYAASLETLKAACGIGDNLRLKP